VNVGKAKLIFRNVAFLGPESVDAASAAYCANEQGQFWPYHDALYTAKVADNTAHYPKSAEGDGFFSKALFVKIATNLKLDIGKFTGCIASKQYDAQVTNETAQAEQEVSTALGKNSISTPTVFVNKAAIEGAQPFAVFQQAIDAALKSPNS
jgi:protein-disulfide isomerase